ncbi:MAG: hypothetical protein PHF86_12265 [Candidatus Nanoarchaeia archaeon]|nr:hypothetical protein [Candidatus Nanoarchaeia archaeon]
MYNIERGGCVGVDESNHGRFPEIIVAAYSNNPEDQIISDLTKIRDKGNIEKIIGNRDFRYIIIHEVYSSMLNPEDLRVMAICEFIKFFKNNNLEDPLFIIDGMLNEKEHEQLDLILYPNFRPHMIIEPKADLHYPIVNIADHIANLIFKKYISQESIDKKLLEKIITPKIEDYVKFMQNVKKNKTRYFHHSPRLKK